MVYLCTPCFLQCQVTLHPYAQFGACRSQQHHDAFNCLSGAQFYCPLCLPNCHSHKFTSYALLPILPAALDESVPVVPNRNMAHWCWLGPYLWMIVDHVVFPSRNGGRAGLAPAHAGREPQRGWAWGKAYKVFALQLASLGSPWVNPVTQRCWRTPAPAWCHLGHGCSWPCLVACRPWITHCKWKTARGVGMSTPTLRSWLTPTLRYG